MSPQHPELHQLFLAALELSLEERDDFLQRRVVDVSLRQQVASWLAAHDEMSSAFLDRPAFDLLDGGTQSPDPLAERLVRGGVLEGRYEIRERLGRGGMGEVWLAYDLKLRVEVALKRLRPLGLSGERERELLRREVRTAREVISTNVCRIFDLIEVEGQELVSMEYIDGETLLSRLGATGRLEVREAMEIASQLLAGLEAIHEAGLVHRDVKPENVMITRAGRVVLMDFGLAKGAADEARAAAAGTTVAGTPAYMAPEQQRGEEVDARADVFASGVLLAEMVSSSAFESHESRESLRAALRQSPPKVPKGPWADVICRAVAQDPAERYPSARALARALEDVSFRAAVAEDRRPYPGLASFGTEDADFFFGREAEVEAVWKKLRSQHLLALVGPSGAGKSSFLRAGLLAAAPPEWGTIVLTPGEHPLAFLRQSLIAELAGDAETMALPVELEDATGAVDAARLWRGRHPEALLIADQFEELFTLSSTEAQETFANLLARLALEADVHVLLSMRDDFLFRCHRHSALAPLFSDLTPLGPPIGQALRRALVQPALVCGYRFEDESLVDDMIAEVANERGALPLLAFAAASLWERRDRERGLLTNQAYEAIGRVSGALALHAESTLEGLGRGSLSFVREIFRNLVTAEGTRAIRARDELLSVFADREPAERVLDRLIEARLLTSFEVSTGGDRGQRTQRVEIIHESLLAAWPRLVRWRTQDADAARVRDQVRQAARLWEERARSEDVLWTGSAYREFSLWKERYPGGLSTSEEAFARAMVERAGRQRRRSRLVVGAALAVAMLVAVTSSTLWRTSESARRRAEASRLVALGRMQLGVYPAATFAFATKSLEVADTPEARKLAIEALARAPLPRALPLDVVPCPPDFHISPDGRWLAISYATGETELRSREGVVQGSVPFPITVEAGDGCYFRPRFTRDGSHLLTWNAVPGRGELWTVPGLERVASIEAGPMSFLLPSHSAILTFTEGVGDRGGLVVVRSWPFDGGSPTVLGEWRRGAQLPMDSPLWAVDEAGTWLFFAKGKSFYRLPLDGLGSDAEELVLEHDEEITWVCCWSDSPRPAFLDRRGRLLLWNVEDRSVEQTRYGIPPEATKLTIDRSGTWLAWYATGGGAYLLDLTAPPDSEPAELLRADEDFVHQFEFDPRGEWLLARHNRSLSFWPLDHARPRALPGFEGKAHMWAMGGEQLGISADGRDLVSCHVASVFVRPLVPGQQRPHLAPGENCVAMAVHPARPEVFLTYAPEGGWKLPQLVPLREGAVLSAPVEATHAIHGAFAVDPAGRVGAWGFWDPVNQPVTFWSFDTGDVRVLHPEPSPAGDSRVLTMSFLADGDLVSGGPGGVWRWDADAGTNEVIYPAVAARLDINRNRDRLVVIEAERYAEVMHSTKLVLLDPEGSVLREITSHGDSTQVVTFDPSGEIVVTGDVDGVVRAGRVTGEEPHLLMGLTDQVKGVVVSPDGRWIYATTGPQTRMWPMPNFSEPPLHILPREELLRRLRSETNIRVVEDAESAEGWRVEMGPFEGLFPASNSVASAHGLDVETVAQRARRKP